MPIKTIALYELARANSTFQFFTYPRNRWANWVQLQQILHRVREHSFCNWIAHYLLQYYMAEVIYAPYGRGKINVLSEAEFSQLDQVIERLKQQKYTQSNRYTFQQTSAYYELTAKRRKYADDDVKLSPLLWLDFPIAFNSLAVCCSDKQGANYSISFKPSYVNFWELNICPPDYLALGATALPRFKTCADFADNDNPNLFSLMYAQRPTVLASLRWVVRFHAYAYEFIRDIPWIRERLIENETPTLKVRPPTSYCMFDNLTEARRFTTRMTREKIFDLTNWNVNRKTQPLRGIHVNSEYVYQLLEHNAQYSHEQWRKK